MTETLTSGITDVFTIMGTAFTNIMSNPILVLFLAGSLIGVGIGAFRKLRSAV